MNKKALVLFSGGQDSTVCLAWALSKFDQVETIGFDYGQRHRIELACRLTVLDRIREKFPEWAEKLGEDRVIDLSWLGQISDCALTEEREIELSENGLPNTFVPGRNLVFFLISSAVAYRRGLSTLVGGMCQTDFSGYPDCREDTLKALQVATNLGMASSFRFETPLMWIDKTETFQLGEQLGEKNCSKSSYETPTPVTQVTEPMSMIGALAAGNVQPAICESEAGIITFHNRINSLKQENLKGPKAPTGLGLHTF